MINTLTGFVVGVTAVVGGWFGFSSNHATSTPVSGAGIAHHFTAPSRSSGKLDSSLTKPRDTIFGITQNITPTSLTVKAKNGARFSFTVASTTAVEVIIASSTSTAGFSNSLLSLSLNKQVQVSYVKNASSTFVTLSVFQNLDLPTQSLPPVVQGTHGSISGSNPSGGPASTTTHQKMIVKEIQ